MAQSTKADCWHEHVVGRCLPGNSQARARAIERKLIVIRESADTIADLISTRTSHSA